MLKHWSIGNKLTASFGLGIAVLVAVGAISYQSSRQQLDTTQKQAHTYQVLGELDDVLSNVKDAETGQRGFVITGNQRYLEPYRASLKVLDQNLRELRRMTADNPEQQRALDSLEPVIKSKLAELAETVDLRQRQGFAAAQQVVQTDRGKEDMDTIRQIIGKMKDEERSLLTQRSTLVSATANNTIRSITLGIPITTLILVAIGLYLSRNISKPLKEVSRVAQKVSEGDLGVRVLPLDRQDEIGILSNTFNQMLENLRETTERLEDQNWLKSNLADFTHRLQGQRALETVAKQILADLARIVNAQHGVFYVVDIHHTPPILKMLSGYAYQRRRHLANEFEFGEGLVGQCATEKEKILLTNVAPDYVAIRSGLGETKPLNIIVLPVVFEEQVTAVIELASIERFSELQLTFLDQAIANLATVLNTIAANLRTEELLRETQALAEELRGQQRELQQSNQQLEDQANALRISEEQLQQQQEELQQNNEELQQLNEELEEKAELLERQKREVDLKNHEIEQARQALEKKAEELAQSSQYKSEFLANMSHELRTPLNSLLILSQLLKDNPDQNLTEKQLEYVRTINSAGTDLLSLINDILDLAKIESGTLVIEPTSVYLRDIRNDMQRLFRQVAIDKNLDFTIAISEDLPETITTDPKRLQQILRNLLSNAFKFTAQGQVEVRIEAMSGEQTELRSLSSLESVIAFAVRDTGIGIAPEKQQVIFEAFQQADGSTSRRYGGTGLGLSISRQLARLLGGEIRLTSQPGQGSTFMLYLPRTRTEPPAQSATSSQPRLAEVGGSPQSSSFSRTETVVTQPPALIADDRAEIQPGDDLLLIIEDDRIFAQTLLDLTRQQGFKGLVALTGEAGLQLARQYSPEAIILDIGLPDVDGWSVLERLKRTPSTRHIPVHIVSASDDSQRGLQMGAIAYRQKPVTREGMTEVLINLREFIQRQVKHLLIVEDDEAQRLSIMELIGNGDVSTQAVGTGAAALEALQNQPFDCVVLDLGLPDMSGLELIEHIQQTLGLTQLPIIIYTARDLTPTETTTLERLAETIIIKDVRSPERLLNETALFLHRVQSNLTPPQQQMLEQVNQTDAVLQGKKVLIVDDDVRNIFALTSLLEHNGMQVLFAEEGNAALTMLQNHPDVQLILMDIMMPGMDGYQTMQAIKQQEPLTNIPIIALTAKAMKGDRDRCIEAGASDYIMKPVDNEQLLSLLRVWLCQR